MLGRVVARTIGETTPGFEAGFDLPDQLPTDNELVETGRLFMQHAEDVKKLFIAKAFPTTFIADITELVDAFEQSVRERDADQVQNANAKASLETALGAGLATVRTLDVMMRVALKDDPAMTATWNKARRVTYPNRGKTAGLAAVTSVSAPAPPVATTTPAPAPATAAMTPASTEAANAVPAAKAVA